MGNHAVYRVIECKCGQEIAICLPESASYLLQKFVSIPGRPKSLIVLGPSSAKCPICGMVHPLPAPETLDEERNTLADYLGE